MLLKVQWEGQNSLFDDIQEFDWYPVRFGVLNEPDKPSLLVLLRDLSEGPITYETDHKLVKDQSIVFSVNIEHVGANGIFCTLLFRSGKVQTVVLGPQCIGYLMTDAGKTVEILLNKVK